MTSVSKSPDSRLMASSDSAEHATSIFSLTAVCVCKLQETIELLKAKEDHDENLFNLEDELGRLRVWMGNLGAHRKQTDRLSLDHRLREAPSLHREVQNTLSGLIDEIGKVKLMASTDASDHQYEYESSEDSDSDEEWQAFKREEEIQDHSELNEYLIDIHHSITSLYKLSITLQNPARRDRTQKAAAIDLKHFEPFDVDHVADKFGLPRESDLARRLGKANTKRRQLLQYHQDHADKIAKYVDIAIEKAKPTAERSAKAPKSISTKWTQDTTVSTVFQIQDIHSDSGRTRFSTATSAANDRTTSLIPPLPPRTSAKSTKPRIESQESENEKNEPFFCPYCRQTIQLENCEEDWKYHVLSDLRPYICTFGNCIKEDQLYDSYTEWSEHEQEFHRRQLFCPLCSVKSPSTDAFHHHLRLNHGSIIPETQFETIIEASWRYNTVAQQCPLCPKPPISDSRRFQQHLARHLQQLALFVLPRNDPEYELEHNDKDAEKCQKTSEMNDEGSQLSVSPLGPPCLTERSPAITKGEQYSPPGTESHTRSERCDGDELELSLGSEGELDEQHRGSTFDLSNVTRSDRSFRDTENSILPAGSLESKYYHRLTDSPHKSTGKSEIGAGANARESNIGILPSSPQRALKFLIDLDSPYGSDAESNYFDQDRHLMGPSKVLARNFPERDGYFATMPPDDVDANPETVGKDSEGHQTRKFILFKDSVGRNFSLPLKLCGTWEGMKDCIERTCFNKDDPEMTAHVEAGHYDLFDSDGQIILSQDWEQKLHPDLVVTMEVWPLPERLTEEILANETNSS